MTPPLPLDDASDFVIAPSILSSDFANLESECRGILDAGADWLHVDVMDGHFVPNLTLGPPIVAALDARVDAVLDVHLMIEEPIQYVERYVEAGADILTVHAEATTHLHRTLQAIRAAGARVGVSLNPATPLCYLEHVIQDVDLVLIMSVNPGFGGQSFIPATIPRLEALRELVQERAPHVVIEVDGGVKVDNIAECARAGARAFVSGLAIFGSDDRAATLDAMRHNVAEALGR